MSKQHSGMRYASLLLVLFVALSLVMAGCNRNRRNQPEDATPVPPTPVVADSAPVPTFTPTPDVPPEPTDTPVPPEPAEPTATNTPEPPKTVAIVQANLRQGPSISYPIVGQVQQNGAVEVVAQSPDLQWLELANGFWIFKQLVAGLPEDIPIATGVSPTPRPPVTPTPTPTATPVPTSTYTPTPTPTPERGDWGKEVPLGSVFDADHNPNTIPSMTLDGLSLKVVKGIYDQSELDHLFGIVGTNRCDRCFAVRVSIENVGGNNVEYVVMEDFHLVKKVASSQAPVTVASPVQCAQNSISTQTNPDNLDKLSRGVGQVAERNICFREVSDREDVIRETYFLVYEPRYIHIPPTPTPDPAATATPTSDAIVTDTSEPSQTFRKGWKVYFALR